MFSFKKLIFLLTVCMLGICMQTKAQIPNVSAYVDSSQVELGSWIKLTIEATVNAGQKTVFPNFKGDTIINGLEIVLRIKPDTIRNADNSVMFKHTFIITSFDDSAYTIPSLPVKVATDTLYTKPLNVRFTLINADSTFTQAIDTTQKLHIFDIQPVKDAKWTFKEFWSRFGNYILIGLIVAVLAALITYFVIKRIKNQPIIPVSKPKEPADVVAVRELQKLKDMQLWQNNKTKDYYSKLTDIIKTYISERYNYSVMESTSRETLKVLDKFLPKPSEAFEKIRFIFETADPVKFAKLQPLPDENSQCMTFAFDFVEATKEQPKIETQNTENENVENAEIDKN